MLDIQRMKFVGYRFTQTMIADLEAFLPQFKKSAGDRATISDLVREGLAFAMEHRSELLRKMAK